MGPAFHSAFPSLDKFPFFFEIEKQNTNARKTNQLIQVNKRQLQNTGEGTRGCKWLIVFVRSRRDGMLDERGGRVNKDALMLQ